MQILLQTYSYRIWGKICWAKLLWFLRVPQKFSHEYQGEYLVTVKHCWPRHYKSISMKNFIGLRLQMFTQQIFPRLRYCIPLYISGSLEMVAILVSNRSGNMTVEVINLIPQFVAVVTVIPVE